LSTGKYKCIPSHYAHTPIFNLGTSEQNKSACESDPKTCTPQPDSKWYINDTAGDEGCDNMTGDYHCLKGPLPSGKIGYDTEESCQNERGCDIKYSRIANFCIDSGDGVTGKYDCEKSFNGTYNSLDACEAVGECKLEKYWTHQGTTCSANGKWQCVKTASQSNSFSTQAECENDTGCPVSYARDYCNQNTGRWNCIYSLVPIKDGSLFKDENAATALAECQQECGGAFVMMKYLNIMYLLGLLGVGRRLLKLCVVVMSQVVCGLIRFLVNMVV